MFNPRTKDEPFMEILSKIIKFKRQMNWSALKEPKAVISIL